MQWYNFPLIPFFKRTGQSSFLFIKSKDFSKSIKATYSLRFKQNIWSNSCECVYIFKCSPRNRVLLHHVMILQVKLRLRYYVLCRSCERWIIIVLNYFWNSLILKCNLSLSMVRSYGILKQQLFITKKYLSALKRFLAVEMRTPKDLVYYETNRYPLFVNSAVRCIRYWLKLTRMEASKLPNKAYRMLYIYIY